MAIFSPVLSLEAKTSYVAYYKAGKKAPKDKHTSANEKGKH